MEEVYVALKAVGVPIEFANPRAQDSERKMGDLHNDLDMYLKLGTTALLVEEIETKNGI